MLIFSSVDQLRDEVGAGHVRIDATCGTQVPYLASARCINLYMMRIDAVSMYIDW